MGKKKTPKSRDFQLEAHPSYLARLAQQSNNNINNNNSNKTPIELSWRTSSCLDSTTGQKRSFLSGKQVIPTLYELCLRLASSQFDRYCEKYPDLPNLLPFDIADQLIGLATRKGSISLENLEKFLGPHISGLDFGFVKYMDPEKAQLSSFVVNNVLPKIKELEVENWEELDELESEYDLVQGCQNLTQLSLAGCSITESTIEKILDGCAHMKYLNLSNVTFKYPITLKSNSLEELDLSFTNFEFSVDLPNLEFLRFAGNYLSQLKPALPFLNRLLFLDLSSLCIEQKYTLYDCLMEVQQFCRLKFLRLKRCGMVRWIDRFLAPNNNFSLFSNLWLLDIRANSRLAPHHYQQLIRLKNLRTLMIASEHSEDLLRFRDTENPLLVLDIAKF